MRTLYPFNTVSLHVRANHPYNGEGNNMKSKHKGLELYNSRNLQPHCTYISGATRFHRFIFKLRGYLKRCIKEVFLGHRRRRLVRTFFKIIEIILRLSQQRAGKETFDRKFPVRFVAAKRKLKMARLPLAETRVKSRFSRLPA